MEKDINAEIKGQMSTTHSHEELQTQLTAITGYRTQFQNYQTAVSNNQKQMADLKHELTSIRTKIYQFGDKITPEAIKKTLKIKEKQLELFGANTKEEYRVNFEELKEVYENLNKIEATAEMGLSQVKENYIARIKIPTCDKYAARQEYLTRSSQILDKAVKVPELKTIVTNTNPTTNSYQEQSTYKETVCTVVQDADTLKTQLQDMGISFNPPPAILGTGLPIVAGVACLVAYSKLVKYEGKLAKGIKKAYHSLTRKEDK